VVPFLCGEKRERRREREKRREGEKTKQNQFVPALPGSSLGTVS